MAKGSDVKVNFISDAKPLVSDIDKMTDALEDGADELARFGKEGEKAGKDLSKGLDKAEDSVDDLEDEIRDLAKAARNSGDDAGDGIRKGVKKGTDGAEDSLKDFKQESASTAKESAASFDGSAESIVDAFQEVAANAFAGFGPAGLAAGLVAAAGIGLVVKAFTDATESAEELEEKTAEVFDQMIESQSKYLAQEFVNENIKTLINDTEEMAEANRIAADSGVDLSTVVRAMAGDQEALAEIHSTVADRLGPLTEKIEAQREATGRASEADLRQLESLQRVRSEFETQEGVYAEAGRRYDVFNKAVTDSAFANDVNLRSVDKLTDGVGRLGSGLTRIPAAVNPKVTVDVDDRKLQNLLNRSYTINIHGQYLDRQGRRMLI